MTPAGWPCPLPDGRSAEEHALLFDRDRDLRLLIVPALFDEGNRLRRLTVEVMRRLDGAGIDTILPDLPGCNESLQPLNEQTPTGWRDAMKAAARHFRASHVLAIRGGVLLAPSDLPGWRYAPVKGASILRHLLRSRIVTAREAGRTETQDELIAQALRSGITLSGYALGVEFVNQFQSLVAEPSIHEEIAQDMIGGSGLWLRAEPDEDRAQADALAAILATGMKA